MIMWKTKLCLNTLHPDMPIKEQIALFRATGFDGFFVLWKNGLDLKDIRD